MAPQPQSQSSERESRGRVLDELLRDKRGQLMHQARFHSRRPEDAEEALSDACVEFLRFYDGPAGEDAVRWMLLVVKRCAWAITRRTEMRSARHGVIDIAAVGDEELQIAALERQLDLSELAARSEETGRLIELIEQLKPDEREALILLGLGCSYAEISEMRGWSRTKVRRCIYEGRVRVREALQRGGKLAMPAPLHDVDTLRSIKFTDALVRLHELIGARVRLSVNLYGRFFGCGVTGTLSRVDTLPPDHSAIVLVLDGHQALFVDPEEVDSFLGHGERGKRWLEFRMGSDASVTVEGEDPQDRPEAG